MCYQTLHECALNTPSLYNSTKPQHLLASSNSCTVRPQAIAVPDYPPCNHLDGNWSVTMPGFGCRVSHHQNVLGELSKENIVLDL